MATLQNQMAPDPVASETFAVVWAALQNTYEGTNVTRTVSRLLHMYQPEDGILAYEQLLRTLYVLLEDFDTNGFRILVSIIPPPTDVPDSAVQEVFQKSTGFTRIIPAFSQTYLNSSNEVGSKRGSDSEKCNRSEEVISIDSDEFRGFPSNEIYTTQIHVQNRNQFHEPTSGNYVSQTYHTCNHNTIQTAETNQDQQNADSASLPIDYRMNWIYAPYLLRKNAICQPAQVYGDPLIIFQSVDQNLEIPISQENQPEITVHSCTNQECLTEEDSACVNFVTTEQEVLNSEVVDLSPERDLKNENSQEMNKEFSEEIEEENLNVKTKIQGPEKSNEESREPHEEEIKHMQRAIQEDIYKMDVVQILETDFIKSEFTTPQYKDLGAGDLKVNKDLRKSIKNFLKRVKSSKTVSAPISPNPTSSTEKTEEIISDETAFIDSWKKIITREVLSRDLKSTSSNSDKKENLSKENSDLTENASELKKESAKRVHRKKPVPATRPKSERLAQRASNRSQVDEVKKKEVALEELNLRFQTKSSTKMLQQANSMAELSNYKKQYYDALLKIQRAKAAVVNSLAISSASSATECNHYYYNYLQYQHQLMQQQQQFLLERQFLNQTALQTVPNNQSSPTSWPDSNGWIYPSFGQFQFCHNSPGVSSGMKPSVFSFVAPDAVTGKVLHYAENECNHVKRKKLEKIVGNLKDPENVSIQQSSSPN